MKYPEIVVKLTGQNGNAFVVLGAIQKALRAGGVPKSEIDEFLADAMSGDYTHLLATACEWVNVS